MPRCRRTAMPRCRLAPAAILIVALAGCGPTSLGPTPGASPSPAAVLPSTIASSQRPNPTPTPDPAAVYAEIAGQVEQIRGLRPTRNVTPVLIDETQLRANLTAEFDRENPPAAVTAEQDELVELGVLPAGASLRQSELDLQAGQVAGYYSPGAGQLYVVSRSGAIGPTQRVTYAHEFTHQLQDQNFDLAKLGLSATDQGDRSLARLALVEGDAVSVQTTWTQEHLSAQDLVQLLADASDPAALAALEHAPPFLRATVLFPYTSGEGFIASLLASGGEAAVDQAFRDPPDSTEQVLHPALFLSREQPLSVALPGQLASALGSGWRELGRDTLGELQIRTWLTSDGVEASSAAAAAAGWGGDRLAILAGPSGALALAIQIAWDSSSDVTEFSSAATLALGRAPGSTQLSQDSATRTTTVVVAPSPALAQRLVAALAR